MVFPAVIWPTSPQLRQRVVPFVDEVRNYQPDAASTPAGERIEYWRKSMIIVGRAPVFGHGTGSIREQFHQVAAGRTGMAALVAANPHNQILATAIQLGLIGTVVLLAMWTAHLLFFFSPGPSRDRICGCHAEYYQLGVQLFAIRFDQWLGLCPGRRRPQRYDAARLVTSAR
jgi:O-antigen ligase